MGQFHAVLGIFLVLIEAIATEPKISVVTALLPPRGPGRVNAGRGARLRVEASGGCFRWVVSQRPDLVVVEEPLQEELPPRRAAEKAAEAACQEACLHAGRQFLPEPEADDGCQPVAIIRSVAEKIENVEKVLVLAQDIQQPGVELRCEVYIANIDRIEVETSVRRINVDDVETLGVKAYDKQGNVFSSLEGLEFRWRLGDASILRSPKLVDSAFKLSPVRRALAEAGAQPDTVLLQGMATGRTTVRANLTIGDPVIVSPEVHLTVLENIVVMPSLLYAPPMAHLQLQLKILRGPRRPLEEFPPVQLPVPHFRWRTQAVEGGEGLLFVDPEMGHVVTQKLGSGRVVAVDSRIENNTAATMIHVTNPVTLRFWTQALWRSPGISIMKQSPGWSGSLESGWEDEELQLLRTATTGVSSDEPVLQLVQGRTYALKLQLEDKNSQLMQIPLNLRAQAHCKASNASTPPLQLLHQAPNSAVLIFRALELGEGHILIENLTLEANKEDKARNLKTKSLKLFAKQAFYVAPQLEPIVPVGGPMLLPRWHSYLLQVRGTGRQVFAIRSQPAGAITVSPDGRVQAGGQLASGELTVQDVRNPHNNFTMRVLVRRAGRLVLQPRYLQIPMPKEKVAEKDEEPVLVRARPEDGSEDADVCEAMCRMLRNLTFWNCTALFSSDRITAEVSNRTVASVRSVASGVFATCNIIRVRPSAPGRFQLTARAQEADASEPLPSTPLPFEVYKPLEWQLLGIKDHDEVIAAAQVDQTAALVLAPCSSIRLRLAEGPRQMNVAGRDSWNLTVGPHITVSRIASRSFQVSCMQVTPGPVQLKGQVTHAPNDPLHGEVFVDNLTLWMRCSVPARVQAAAEVEDLEDDAVVDKEPRQALGVQRGQATRFRARFVDAFGRTMVNASEYTLRWSLSPSSKEGTTPFQKAWLAVKKETSAASINVPAEATVGATAKLGLEVSLPPASLCPNISMATLVALPLPSSDELPVIVARKLELRWPGYPQKARFAMFKNLSIVVEAGFGTGRARLEILSGHDVLEVIEPSQICSGQPGPCVPALWIGSPCNASRADDVQRWFLHAKGQGTASLAFWDPDLLGARPQPLEVTIRAAKQLDVSLLGEDTGHSDGRTVLVVRGTDRPLRVDVRDADGQALGMVNWLPLGLKVHSSDPGALEVKNSSRCGEYECLCHTPGTYRLFADMQDYPNGTIHSRVLHVECLPEFDVVLKDIVVMPGQAFELAFTGGPGRNDRTYFDYISSDPEVVSIDNEVGLVLALKPGDADLWLRLLERASGREIARKGAHVKVRVPTAASIGAVESLAGASREESSPALLRDSDEALRLRARIWSGDLELTPLLLALAASKVGPLTSNLKGQNLLISALDMGETIVEAAEAASQTALQLAASSGFRGSDAAVAAAAHGVSCRFRWSTEPGAVALVPVGQGALAVELRANSSSPEQLEVALVAECPLGRGYESLQLETKTVLPVLPMLKLLHPTGPCTAYPRILVPRHGRVPLTFSMPRSQLKVEILGGTAVQLLETAEMVEVEAGSEGEASLKVEVLASLHSPPMEISVSSRKVFAARMDSVPARLPLSASAVCPLYLVDATGQTLTLPSNFEVQASSSLTSVVTAEAERFAGGAVLHLRAVGEGCALLSFAVRLPDSRQLPSDIAEVCVVRGALVGHGPLLLQPGARLNLDAEELAAGAAAGFSAGRPPIAFSLRLSQSGSRSLEEAASSLATDLSESLAEGLAVRGGRRTALPVEVKTTAARWAVREARRDAPVVQLEVDLQVSASDLAKAAGESGELGLFDLAEVLWKENISRSETLQLLDLSWGLHGTSKASSLEDQRCAGCCVSSSRCRSCCAAGAPGRCFSQSAIAGWSSSHPTLAVETSNGAGPIAIAQAPGTATLRYCDGVVSADIQVVVARPGELQVEDSPQGGPTEALRARKLVSNQVDAELAVKFRSFREGGAQAEDELRSGPFIAQNIRLECEPLEAAMGQFFIFKAVDETCVVRPRAPSTSALRQSAPLQVALAASLQGSSSRGLAVEWQFVPQFVVMKASEALAPAQVCATLTTSSPIVEVPVWTGGHHIEADLEALPSRRMGNLTLEVQPSHFPVTSLRIRWNDAVESGKPEEVNLRLSSPATGQVEVYRVRIEPSSQVSCAPDGGWSLMEILLLAAAILALLWLLLRLCAKPTAPPDHLGAAFQGVGAGPFLSGDPFAGPHAVSPFNALG